MNSCGRGCAGLANNRIGDYKELQRLASLPLIGPLLARCIAAGSRRKPEALPKVLAALPGHDEHRRKAHRSAVIVQRHVRGSQARKQQTIAPGPAAAPGPATPTVREAVPPRAAQPQSSSTDEIQPFQGT